MASPSSTAIFLLFLLSATLVLPSHAQLGGLISVTGIQVAGRLFCSVDGNPCPTCSGLGGVNVTISCNGGTINVGSLVTDPSGNLAGVLNLVDGLLFDISSCFATVQLPVANCTLLAPTGNLRAPVTFLGNFITGVLGLLYNTVIGLFVLVL